MLLAAQKKKVRSSLQTMIRYAEYLSGLQIFLAFDEGTCRGGSPRGLAEQTRKLTLIVGIYRHCAVAARRREWDC